MNWIVTEKLSGMSHCLRQFSIDSLSRPPNKPNLRWPSMQNPGMTQYIIDVYLEVVEETQPTSIETSLKRCHISKSPRAAWGPENLWWALSCSFFFYDTNLRRHLCFVQVSVSFSLLKIKHTIQHFWMAIDLIYWN